MVEGFSIVFFREDFVGGEVEGLIFFFRVILWCWRFRVIWRFVRKEILVIFSFSIVVREF